MVFSWLSPFSACHARVNVLPERDHPALLLLLVLLMMAPSLGLLAMDPAQAPGLAVHSMGVLLLVLGVFLALGLADTMLPGFVALAAVSSWGAVQLLPGPWSLASIAAAAAATAILVALTRGLPRIIVLCASLLMAVLLLQVLPMLPQKPPPDWQWLLLPAIAIGIVLLLVIGLAHSAAADALRLHMQDAATADLLAVPMARLQLIVAAMGGAVAAGGCLLLDRIGWSPLAETGADARLATCLALVAVFIAGGPNRLSGMLIVALPLLVLPHLLRIISPSFPDPTVALAIAAIFLAAWPGRRLLQS